MRNFIRMLHSSEKSYKLHYVVLVILGIVIGINFCTCFGKTIWKEKYLAFHMTTITFQGGIGNQLFEVISLIAIARRLNRTAIFNLDNPVLQSNLTLLNEKLPRIAEQVVSIPIKVSETTFFANSQDCCRYELPDKLWNIKSEFLYIEGHYFQSYKYFESIKSSIKDWLKPSVTVMEKLTRKVNNTAGHKSCVHVRRGDFLTDSTHVGTDSNYTVKAMDHLRSLYQGVMFIMSNDPRWVQSHIVDRLEYQEDVRIMDTSPEDAINDIHFSQMYCDSVLITAPSSTFGWWIGYLSKNQSAVYYRDIRETKDRVQREMTDEDFYPAIWTKLKFADL